MHGLFECLIGLGSEEFRPLGNASCSVAEVVRLYLQTTLNMMLQTITARPPYAQTPTIWYHSAAGPSGP